ncbi:amidase [Roseomonas sp. SSH11]|uniref:Amidase n=1 Tax=Pararoseomonas baculiformis TaxID=2820812 RepID=A0ABS4AAV5_9PROT|nr:amidase [Pararoseomonas baculiformis]MBP0444137.1 amidase [Pararoseomonas baculiformis]
MSDEDRASGFMPGKRPSLPHASGGPLAGLTFAAKDLYDVAGHPTTYGNPDWARTHGAAVSTAPAVLALAEAGARFLGKTKTVELAFGLTGENVWYGTPLNPAAPDRFPGGSSCGSASVVARGEADIALGSDTGGSVRIPASYCGIYGIRPSWGAVSLVGARALAPSYDTAGWFAARASVLRLAGEALLPEGGEAPLGPVLRVQEAWMNAQPAVAAALAPALESVEKVLGSGLQLWLVPETLPALYEHFRALQAEEAWATLGGWIEATKPELGPGVAERFAMARDMDPAKVKAARSFRQGFRHRLAALLGGGAVLAYPTSPLVAPKLDASPAEQLWVREVTLAVTSIAGMGGLCEVSIPAATVDDAPVGLSLVAAPGRDRALLALAEQVADRMGLPV